MNPSPSPGEIDPTCMNPADYVDALRNQRFDEEQRHRRARYMKTKQRPDTISTLEPQSGDGER